MDRRHLRGKNRIILPHVLGERDALEFRRHNMAFCRVFLADADGREQRTHTDSRCAKIINLIDFEAGVDLTAI